MAFHCRYNEVTVIIREKNNYKYCLDDGEVIGETRRGYTSKEKKMKEVLAQ